MIQASETLHINTSNARVTVNVGLLNDSPTEATKMVIQTSNGYVPQFFVQH